MAEMIEIEVVYAAAGRQALVRLPVPAGCTVGEAVRRSELALRFPEIDPANCPVGVFGRLRERDAVLQPGDRVEIYRPLIADPKLARRQRARNKPTSSR